ncbi:hypothetical protein ACM26W_06460 [Halomonas sp. HK25]|uniref:hypothetical protein n=1 Tax=Halomonas sp. HK25 TaxID=3394321 RepID=UPI0039FDB78A
MSDDARGPERIRNLALTGYADFQGATLSILPAVETVAVVIDAAPERLPALLDALRERFGPECLALNLPAQGATRVVDCFFSPDGEADFASVAEAHERLVDQVVERCGPGELCALTKVEEATLDSVLHDSHDEDHIRLRPVALPAPGAAMGDLSADLSASRGRILDTRTLGDQVSLQALVPLAEVLDYPSRLNALTGGAGTYSLRFSHYEPAPESVQQRLIRAYRPQEDEG